MIIFDLVCELEHQFEGWFKKTSDFDTQLMNGQLTCPVCGINEILKLNDNNTANNVIEIKPYKLLKEKLNKSELLLNNTEVDLNALTSDFIERLNNFVEQHFDDLDVNVLTQVNSIDNSNIISSKAEQDEVKVIADDGVPFLTTRPKKNKKLN